MISVSEYALSTGLVKVMASAVGCWSTLTAVRLELQQVQRQMRIKSLYSLGRYLYASSKSKYISAALIAVLTAANTYINSLGRGFKTTVEHYLENRPVQEGRDNALKSSCWTVVLLAWRSLGVWVWSYVMTRTTNEFINLSAGQRRQAVTAQLFEALSHTPLSYFDKHTYDDVEEIMYYVDDMEGVDVQVHQFLFNTVSTFALLRSTFREVHGRVLLLAVIAAVAPRLLNRLAGLVEQYYGVLQREGYLSWIGQGKEMDKKDEEDGFARDGMWLRGLEIVGAIHQLRPYGADVRLVHWWNQQSQHKRDESFDGADYIMGAFRALFSLPWGQSVAALGYASLQTAEWLLPITITTVVARRWKIHNVVSVTYASSVIESALSVVTDGNDLMEMILHNAYKTSVLEHVLRPERFEESTLAERKHWHNYVTARMTCFTASGVQVPDCCVSGSSLLDGKFHRSHVLHKVTLHRVQFRYPTMMDVAVFPKPFSAEIVLQDANGVGRMVCLTGPPSCGKTTLAHLLLSLYMVEESEEGEEGDAPPITFTFHGGPDVRLYKSGGSVCSLSRRGVSHSSSPVSRTAPTVDEVDLKRIPVDLLRSHVFSYVPQESILFDGASIAQNVSLNGYVSLASVQTVRQVERCMAATGCKFVEQFPQGVLTRITSSSMSRTLGAGGAADRRAYQRLSADQADRLMMARALYHGADILLLDDPVAHLDEEATLGFITLWRSLLQSGRLHGVLCFTNSPTLLNAADEVITIA
ncbi:ABC transporter [Angomonas deanei]|nr:ABC transporter [Angomonas deanei]|eukprot:EPY34009.1 ABC transporter [Angomonas deanei]